MTKEELRIGNYVLGQTKQITKVDGFFNENKAIYTDVEDERVRFIIHYLNECEGILLTEKILLKCGFNKNELGGYIMYTELGSMLCIYKDGSFRSNERYIDTKIKYLHQLQNLIYALTGTELNIVL